MARIKALNQGMGNLEAVSSGKHSPVSSKLGGSWQRKKPKIASIALWAGEDGDKG